MKRIIITKDSSKMSFGSHDINIEFVKDLTPQEAVKFLDTELNQWNKLALDTIKQIKIE